ncbi:MAG: nucleotidyltransferase domain-containing protein [Lachnospiraceae bacterium]|nr:nucleotidyltransferase domain-containing protein [Lachnospiraceae bacterium]MEE0863449.1 nucleotidyltransferase domain-containing protein [Lachnospiraceae bacterium]
MPDIVSNLLFGFTRQLKSMLGNNLSKVIVYGSYARGDYCENSDVDVMVLVKLSESEIKKILPEIYDMAYDIELENDIHISVVIKNEEQFEYWSDTLPFYRNVNKEGVEINAG